jgi:hypothetical protein
MSLPMRALTTAGVPSGGGAVGIEPRHAPGARTAGVTRRRRARRAPPPLEWCKRPSRGVSR